MGKSTPSAPAAPDPTTTANAQTASNQATALYNFGLNNPNVYSPLGSSTFTSNGKDANGTPIYNQNITLSPQQQALLDQQSKNQLQQGQTAGTALNNVTNLFNTPYDLKGNVSATPSQEDLQADYNNQYKTLYNQQTAYLDPQYQNQQNQLDAKLSNQGILPGSQAYQNAQDEQSRNQTFAYQQAADQAQAGAGSEQTRMANLGLQNQQQQAQMYTQQYQEPLNLYSSLMSGTAPTMPQFSSANTSQAAPTNVLGAYNSAYQGQLNNYNTAVGSSNSAKNGMTGAATTLGAAALMSDVRLKKNIKHMGFTKRNLPVYEYEYIWDSKKHIGVMAQDVEKVLPEAVITMDNGYKAVNYAIL